MSALEVLALTPPALESTPAAVIDTNALFDWLVFADRGCQALAESVRAGRLRWLATRAMRDECFHVLGRGGLARWQPDLRSVEAAWDTHCEFVEALPLTGPGGLLRCSDPDDQMFIDLALGHRTQWLISKDRAVLRLSARLRRLGVEAVTPAAWAAREAATAGMGR